MSLGISGGRTQRKGHPVLYVKDSENIEDILTFIGARQSTIDLMNIKMYATRQTVLQTVIQRTLTRSFLPQCVS